VGFPGGGKTDPLSSIEHSPLECEMAALDGEAVVRICPLRGKRGRAVEAVRWKGRWNGFTRHVTAGSTALALPYFERTHEGAELVGQHRQLLASLNGLL